MCVYFFFVSFQKTIEQNNQKKRKTMATTRNKKSNFENSRNEKETANFRRAKRKPPIYICIYCIAKTQQQQHTTKKQRIYDFCYYEIMQYIRAVYVYNIYVYNEYTQYGSLSRTLIFKINSVFGVVLQINRNQKGTHQPKETKNSL